MEIEIRLTHMQPHEARNSMREAIAKEKNRSLPMHRRKAAVEAADHDYDTEDAEEENDKLVELASENGEPSEIPMTDEDMSEDAVKPLLKQKAKKSASKIGKPYQPK